MTSLAVELPPPGAADITATLSRETPLGEFEARDLLLSVARDVIRAAHGSGGDLVVIGESEPSPATEQLGWEAPATAIRKLIDAAIPATEEVRTVWRDGNGTPADLETRLAITQEAAAAASTAVLNPITPLLQRRHIDAAAMRLRTHDLVLGPSTGCQWYFAGVSDEFSFHPAGADVQLSALAVGGAEASGDLSLLPCLPSISTGAELASVVSIIEASRLTEDDIAPHTRAWLDESLIHTDLEAPGARLVRD